MKKGHSYITLKVLKIVRLLLSICLLSMCLTFSIVGHCEDNIRPLPYYVNYYYTDYFNLTSDQLDLITSYTANSDFNIIWLGEPVEKTNRWEVNLYCYQIGENGSVSLKNGSDLTIDVPYQMFDIDNDYVVLTKSGGSFVKKVIRISKSDGAWTWQSVTNPTVQSVSLLHLSTKQINQFGFTPNVPLIFQGSDPMLWNGSSEQIIFSNGQPVVPSPGGENITDDETKPIFSDYSVDWTTGKPTFDSEHPFDSLFDIMSWSFGKLADTVSGGFNYIVDSLNWSLQTFLNNVRAKFQLVIDAVNDFADMVEDKIEEIKGYLTKLVDLYDYISQPFDSTKIQTAFNNMAVKTDYNSLTTLVNSAFSVFDATSEPNTFRIPVHLENIPILHINSVQYIDLGWIYESRSIIRAFIWCMTTFSLLYTIIDALPSYLQGNDE